MKSKKTSSKRSENQPYTIQLKPILIFVSPTDVPQQPLVHNNFKDRSMNIAKVTSINKGIAQWDDRRVCSECCFYLTL